MFMLGLFFFLYAPEFQSVLYLLAVRCSLYCPRHPSTMRREQQ